MDWRGVLRHFMPRAAAAVQTTTSFTPMQSEILRILGSRTSSGKSVTEDSALGLSATFACQRIIAESLGMIPWGIRRKTQDGNSEAAEDHWLQDVLVDSPNADQDTVEFRETLAAQLCGNGNTYSMIDRAGSRVTSLYPMQSNQTKPMRKRGSNTRLEIPDGEVFFRYNDRGQPFDLPREKVWHVKGFGRDPIEGLSPIGIVRETFGGGLAVEDFAHRFFSQGGFPAGIVSTPTWLKPDQREIARENLQQIVGGLGNAHKFALFEGGLKVDPWESMNLEDMQFILSRRFSVLEICRIYRVPPHMVAELEKGASYASIEQMSIEFVMFTLMPYFSRFEASVSKWLLPPAERGKFFLKFDFEALLRTSFKDLADYLSTCVNNGLMHRNEGRARLGLNRSEEKGMDSFTVQTALTPIEKLGEAPPPSTTGKNPPPDDPGDQGDGDGGENMEALRRARPINLSVSLHPTVNVGAAKAPDVRVSMPAPIVNVSPAKVEVAPPSVHVNVPEQSHEFTVRVPGLEGALEETRAAFSDLAKAIKAPRKIVTDAGGNPIGSRLEE